LKKKKIPLKKIIDMQLKKTGRLFCFCCVVPVIIAKKNIKIIKKFEVIGSDIGLLYQIADDLIDYKGDSKKVGKKTNKDQKQGKSNLISLLGYNNTVIYGKNLKLKIQKKLKNYGKKSNNLSETLEYFLYRNK
jgi:farnesyl diphosphate synthase